MLAARIVLAFAGAFAAHRALAAYQRGDEAVDQSPDAIDSIRALAGGAMEAFDPYAQDLAARNRAAFLQVIAEAEGTTQAGGYQTLYGSTPDVRRLFNSFDDHPAAVGWPGVVLTDDQCAGAGLGPGCRSTAAGRYQITLTTWRRLRDALGGELPDFSPQSQDRAALELIRERGALRDVEAGDVLTAAGKVRRVWASLPGAGYQGQRERSAQFIAQAFANAGGVMA